MTPDELKNTNPITPEVEIDPVVELKSWKEKYMKLDADFQELKISNKITKFKDIYIEAGGNPSAYGHFSRLTRDTLAKADNAGIRDTIKALKEGDYALFFVPPTQTPSAPKIPAQTNFGGVNTGLQYGSITTNTNVKDPRQETAPDSQGLTAFFAEMRAKSKKD